MSQEPKEAMLPPWEKYPDIERFSIGWRMGYGQGYMRQWQDWLKQLDQEEVTRYRQTWPEPDKWYSFYDFILHGTELKFRPISEEELSSIIPQEIENMLYDRDRIRKLLRAYFEFDSDYPAMSREEMIRTGMRKMGYRDPAGCLWEYRAFGSGGVELERLR